MIIVSDKVIGLNKKGTQVPLPTSIILAVANLTAEGCTLDGEIVGDTLYVFDILSKHGENLETYPCWQRIAYLNAMKFGDAVEIVETAYTKEEKQVLFDKLKKENREGIVFKKNDSPYEHGRPNSGGNQLKHKFYKTATFIVQGTTEGKRSVGLELVAENDNRVFMGKVTIPPNHEIPNEGELVEVRYLYAYKGGAVFQPTYLGVRNDSDLTDATMKQIVYKEGQEQEA